MAMLRQTIRDSDAVEEVGYDLDTRELRIVFTGWREYAYFEVPPDVVQHLLTAESVGRFVSEHIKPFYRYREVESHLH